MISWWPKNNKQALAYEIEVNIMGIFDQIFIKENFTLKLAKETPVEAALQLVEKKLGINLFTKFKGELPANWAVLVNGNRLDLPMKDTTLLKGKDQLSVLSILGGG
jgi:hypothetical protein